jgi:catechol 2,3-dioxygenase-like lactoylglutathione lyase family enzyme
MSGIRFIDHVQLAMPPGKEAKARAFYGGVLDMEELAKPPVLAARGGAWFQAGKAQLHLGVEAAFRPARKAHVALGIRDGAALRLKLKDAGHEVRDDDTMSGTKRFFTDDAFGNRLEFIEVDE